MTEFNVINWLKEMGRDPNFVSIEALSLLSRLGEKYDSLQEENKALRDALQEFIKAADLFLPMVDTGDKKQLAFYIAKHTANQILKNTTK